MHVIRPCRIHMFIWHCPKQLKSWHFPEIERTECGAVIQFLTLEVENPTNIHQRLVNVYGCLLLCHSHFLESQFKRDRDDVKDVPRYGRPIIGPMMGNVEKVDQMVLETRKISVDGIVPVWRLAQSLGYYMIIHACPRCAQDRRLKYWPLIWISHLSL